MTPIFLLAQGFQVRRDASPLHHVLLVVFPLSFLLPLLPPLIVTRIHLRLHCSWKERLRAILLLGVLSLLLPPPLLALVKLQSCCAAEVGLSLPGAEVAGRLGAL